MKNVDERGAVFAAAATNRLAVMSTAGQARKPVMKVVHSIEANGPKLVEMGPEEIAALRVSDPGVKALPVVEYELMRMPRLEVVTKAAASAALALATKLQVTFVDAKTKKAVKGVTVVAFTNFAKREGASGTTNSKGVVTLGFPGTSVKLDLLVAYSPAGYWGYGKRKFTLKTGSTLAVEPVNLALPDFAAALYGNRPVNAGQGVKVGVIDTGVDGAHPDLVVAGGAAFVVDEGDAGGSGPAAKDGDHGTHVAGIIASRGAPHPDDAHHAPGKRGIAPQVTLMSYRVFPNAGGGASNYDIIRAIDQGVKDGCDLLNLSLGSQVPDDTVHAAMKDAFDQGTVCVVAAGNDERKPVSYPAAWDVAVAVSSLGKKGTYPATSNEILDEVPPFAKSDPKIYVSAFSNVGPAIDVCGPGEGIVSTLPGGKYGVMSGTSMACPAVTGVTAALLSANTPVLNMARNRDRSIAIMGLITGSAKTLGFIQPMEGVGLIP
ncbi:MAG TPA: S8 family serine peptidase [Roseateles sp.]|uniref:S8 family serine peptidase n=1 Tax=Roseateles sp. TaxID=1971397 RepID=UPI002ED8FD05